MAGDAIDTAKETYGNLQQGNYGRAAIGVAKLGCEFAKLCKLAGKGAKLLGIFGGRAVKAVCDRFGRSPDIANRPRVRHHTSPDGASGITRDGAINPSRGDPQGVHVEREPFGSTSTASDEVGAFGNGRYVEFDEPPGIVPTNVGPRNTGVIPSNSPLDVSESNPRVGRQ